MAATGNEAVRLSQLKGAYGGLDARIGELEGADTLFQNGSGVGSGEFQLSDYPNQYRVLLFVYTDGSRYYTQATATTVLNANVCLFRTVYDAGNSKFMCATLTASLSVGSKFVELSQGTQFAYSPSATGLEGCPLKVVQVIGIR